MNSTPSLPKVIGISDIPVKPEPKPRPGKRGPGRFYLYGGELSASARQVVETLEPGQAKVLAFDDPEALAEYQVLLHNVNRTSYRHLFKAIRTKRRGLSLLVWLRDYEVQ